MLASFVLEREWSEVGSRDTRWNGGVSGYCSSINFFMVSSGLEFNTKLHCWSIPRTGSAPTSRDPSLCRSVCMNTACSLWRTCRSRDGPCPALSGPGHLLLPVPVFCRQSICPPVILCCVVHRQCGCGSSLVLFCHHGVTLTRGNHSMDRMCPGEHRRRFSLTPC